MTDGTTTSKQRPPYAAEGLIRDFFDRMKSMGAPPKVDTKWAENWQFGANQPAQIPGLLKWLGVSDKDGTISADDWTALRTDQEATLARLVRDSYASIFSAIEVESADRETIKRAFINAYQSGDTGRQLTAFATLCELAGIRRPEPGASDAAKSAKAIGSPSPKNNAAPRTTAKVASTPPLAKQASPAPEPAIPPNQSAATVTFNVEIPAEWNGDQVLQRVTEVLNAVRSVENR